MFWVYLRRFFEVFLNKPKTNIMKNFHSRLLRTVVGMRRVVRKLRQSEGVNISVCFSGLALMAVSAGNIEPETPTCIGGVILGITMALWAVGNYEKKQQLKKKSC